MGNRVLRQSTQSLQNFITRALRTTRTNSSGDNLDGPGGGQESELGQASLLLGQEFWAGTGFQLCDGLMGFRLPSY